MFKVNFKLLKLQPGKVKYFILDASIIVRHKSPGTALLYKRQQLIL